MAQPVIRPATLADATAISSLSAQLGYEASKSEVSERLAILLQREDYFVAVAEAPGGVVGWVAAEHRVQLLIEPSVEIMGLVTASGHRRSGIGTALVAGFVRHKSQHAYVKPSRC